VQRLPARLYAPGVHGQRELDPVGDRIGNDASHHNRVFGHDGEVHQDHANGSVDELLVDRRAPRDPLSAPVEGSGLIRVRAFGLKTHNGPRSLHQGVSPLARADSTAHKGISPAA